MSWEVVFVVWIGMGFVLLYRDVKELGMRWHADALTLFGATGMAVNHVFDLGRAAAPLSIAVVAAIGGLIAMVEGWWKP